jgi:tetratricopeptide (TPR) repeat protein
MSKRSRTHGKKNPPGRSGKNRTQPGGNVRSTTAITDRDFKRLSIFIVMVVAWIAYANAMHNTLTFDDVTFSPLSRSWEIGLTEARDYFTSDVWASAGKETGLYRPVFLLAVAAEIQIFGEWYTGYHLVNVLLHSLVALSLFGLVRYLLLATGSVPRLSNYAALLATLAYTVHPVHTEVVNSIFNGSGILVALGVTSGLLWFLPAVERSPRKAWAVINLVYLLILFCKETAAIFPAILVSTLLVTTPGNWHMRLRRCIPVLSMILPLGLYLALRSMALATGDVTGAVEQTVIDVSAAQTREPLLERLRLGFNPGNLFQAIRVWFDALVTMLWPHPLLAFHKFSTTNFWLALIAQAGLLAFAVAALLRKFPGPLLGLVFFYLALLPSSRIISLPGHFVLAERYLYLPSIGLTIALAFLLVWMLKKIPAKGIAVAMLLVVIVMTPLTWARNANWSSNISLTESDYSKGNQIGKNMQVLTSSLVMKGDLVRARKLCDRHADQFPSDWFFSATCGQVYEKLKLPNKAEKAYLFALNSPVGKASAHYSLAIHYLSQNRNDEAREQFEEAIAAEKQDYMKEYLAAQMLMRLYPNQRAKLLEAKSHLQNAIALQPQVLFTKAKLDQLNTKLGGVTEKQN